MSKIDHKIGACVPCDEPVAHFHRPGGGPWFCASCGAAEGAMAAARRAPVIGPPRAPVAASGKPVDQAEATRRIDRYRESHLAEMVKHWPGSRLRSAERQAVLEVDFLRDQTSLSEGHIAVVLGLYDND